MASATLARFTGDASDGTSSVGLKPSDQPPSASSVFTARRLPPRSWREPNVERPRVELRLGLIVVIDVEEHEALGFRGRPPVAGHGLECQSSGGHVDDAVGTRADQACRAVTPGDDLDDPQARM